jgi:hypothetical protein
MYKNMNSFGPKKTLRAMNFCKRAAGQSVGLVADFNSGISVIPKHMPDGAWLLAVKLNHGHHRYAFLVDGNLTLDPRAQELPQR